MSTYTTTIWEVIKDLNDRQPDDIQKLIEKYRNKIFNFDYAVPNSLNKNEFKKWFETSFITKYLTYEIGSETFELFQIRLYSTCLRKMPIFAKQIDNVVKVLPKDFFHGQYGTVIKHSDSKTDNKSNAKGMGSTLPINMISANAISDVKYADSASKNENSAENKNVYDDKTTYDLTYFIDVVGLLSYNKELRNIYDGLFEEFEYLFLGVL